MGSIIRRTVPEGDAGIRLDMFLARQPEVGTRSQAKELIDRGCVRVAGARIRPGLFLEAGQEVTFQLLDPEPPAPGPAAPAPELPVLFADDWIAVIDKPSGIACHPPEDKDFSGPTVASLAEARFGPLPTVGGPDRPGIVHRLDRDTSGVMVVARNDEAFHFLRAEWKRRAVQKEYRCIAYGESRFQSDWIERAIAVDPRHGDRMTVVDTGGRESSTFYEVVERFLGFTHFRCLPQTGRTHQIRVHLTSIGHSLVGDRLYRSRRAQHQALPAGAPDPGRQCLHAFRLGFRHPATHEEVAFEAPLPADMLALLDYLRAMRPFAGP